MKVVVDASFLLESLAEGTLADKAREVQAKLLTIGHLIAPTIAVYELGNYILARRPKAGTDGDEDPNDQFEAMLQDVTCLTASIEGLKRTGLLARQYNLSFYDAAYLATAEAEPESMLLTQDRRLGEAGKQLLGKERSLDIGAAYVRFLEGAHIRG